MTYAQAAAYTSALAAVVIPAAYAVASALMVYIGHPVF